MVTLRKRTSRKGRRLGEDECSSSPVTSSSCESHVDLASETANTKGSMRHRLKEIKGNIAGSIRGNIKKRLSTSSISLPKDIAGVDDEEQQPPWPALRKSISSITSSLRNQRSSMDCRSPRDIAQHPIPNRPRDGSHLSQDADRRSHTIHACRAAPGLGRSESQMRRHSLGVLLEPSSDYDSTPRLPSLYKMLAKAEGETHSKDSSGDAEDGLGLCYDPDTPLFDIDWHDVASQINVIEEIVAKQKATAKDPTPIPGPLPIRLETELPTMAAPDGSSPTQDKKGGSMSDSGISGCSTPAVDSSLGGHKATEEQNTWQATQQNDVPAAPHKSHRVSIKWASQVSEISTTTTKTKIGHSAPATPVVFQTSRVPIHWLDSILETSLGLRSLDQPRLPHADDAGIWEQGVIARAQETGKIAVITPGRSERLLPKLYYDDFKTAAEDLFGRFRWQYSPIMAFAPSRRAIYLYPPGARGEAGALPSAPDARPFDIEAVAGGHWGDLGSAPGLARDDAADREVEDEEEEEDGGDYESVSSGATEMPARLAVAAGPYREGLEWIDPEGEAYMRSEISLLQDYDSDAEMASRLG